MKNVLYKSALKRLSEGAMMMYVARAFRVSVKKCLEYTIEQTKANIE